MNATLWLGRRFALLGDRAARTRTILNAIGVAVGVALVLLTLTALPSLSGRDHRSAWHATSAATPTSAADRALWLATPDHFLGQDLFVVQVAALGPRPPVPPGLARLPGPGDVVVSPALRDLIAATPYDALGARFPGTAGSVLGPAGLAYPEELVAIVGRTPEQLRAVGASEVSGIAASAPGALDVPVVRVLLTIGAIGLLVPVIVFIATAARVSAARREQRYAALRLVGGTRGQVAVMAAVETSIGAIGGTALGWLAYQAARPVVARTFTFDGAHFMSADVHAPTVPQILVLLGVPLLCAAATVVSLRAAQVTPLGVTRRARTRRPGWWRLTPVAAGVAGLVTIASTDLTDTTRSSVTTAQLLIGGTFGSLLLGLILAGPLLCSLVARALSRFSRRLPELMAARRIAADPYTTFRAVSGVAVAALVATMFAGSAAGVGANLDRPDQDALRADAVEILLDGHPDVPLLAALAATPDVLRTVVARQDPAAPDAIAVSCPDLAAAVNIACPGPPSAFGRIPPGLGGIRRLDPPDLALPVHAIYVVTGDSSLTTEEVRTLAARLAPGAPVSTGRDLVELDRRQLTELEAGLQAGLIFVLLVAAASITLGVVAGLLDRRRPFALLRATGIQLRELRRMVLLETALPLAVTGVFGIALGLATSAAVASAGSQRWTLPGPGFAVSVVAGPLLTLGVSATALPLLKTATEPNSVRFE